ncbi:MAG: serine dehydratase [Ignavibacteriae bacterium]|nr:serine dehydratase [Ignavibacteriota bacterium]NOG99995.1 serine dehydratase [Ignavibacteriota bacterium]
MANYPSIFNDVIGPVMRGPSSSHCAAAVRIGRLCRELMEGKIDEMNIKFDPNGSLATTHESQGSDMGFFAGLLGWEAFDERLPSYKSAIADAGMKINIEITDISASHPNTYEIELRNKREIRRLTALSTGGGMIEIIKIDGAELLIEGDYFETLVYTSNSEKVKMFFENNFVFDELNICLGKESFIEIKAQRFPDEELLNELKKLDEVKSIKKLSPVLPILSRKNIEVPFTNCEEMLEYNKDKNLDLWELAVHYESARGNLNHDEVREKMKAIVKIMRDSVELGLKGTEYKDRILGNQSKNFKARIDNNTLIGGEVINRIILYVTAIMEVKSSMGVIVAAPTAGSCGALPGAVLGIADSMKINEDKIVKAMIASAIIGVFISKHSTFAAEVGGCMAECGSGSGMAAAALVYLADGTLEQSISAASVALQNSFGMTCDPIANRVEAPCLGKNIMAATNALSCANMALANYNHLIPLDEVIDSMAEVAESMPRTLRCTALGGLSMTKSAKEIEKRLNTS